MSVERTDNQTAQFKDLEDEEIESATNGPPVNPNPTAPSAMQSNTGEANEERDALTDDDTGQGDKPEPPPAQDEESQYIQLSALHQPVTVEGDVNIGMEDSIYLPSEEEQRAGFHTENWQALVTQYQGIYKPIKKSERKSLVTKEVKEDDTKTQ